jgi:Co/Zn/Cd efflux system component
MAMVISVAIIYTSIPIVKQTKDILLLATPENLQRELFKCMGEVLSSEGVLECSQDHFWTCATGQVVGSMCLTVADKADEQALLQRVQSIFRPHVQNLTVEIQRNNWDVSSQLRDVDVSH